MCFLLQACYPEGPESLEDYDLVASNYQQDFDFSTIRTFYLVDTVVHITESSEISSSSSIDRGIDQFILDQVAANLIRLGYTRITSLTGSPPDFLVTTSALTVENINAYYDYWWNYWGWWEGWGNWYPGYAGGWYPWGYGFLWTYSEKYTIGTLLVEMSLPKSPKMDEKRFPLIWMGALNGVLTTNTNNTQTRIANGLTKAFDQTPAFKNGR